jgi:hypothetical protein
MLLLSKNDEYPKTVPHDWQGNIAEKWQVMFYLGRNPELSPTVVRFWLSLGPNGRAIATVVLGLVQRSVRFDKDLVGRAAMQWVG